MDREAYIKVIEKYSKLLGEIEQCTPFTYIYEIMSDEGLHDLAYALYKKIKHAINNMMVDRYTQYEMNRHQHIPNKTAEKAYYRFCKASGMICEYDLMRVSIKRLIRIYEVYFSNGRV